MAELLVEKREGMERHIKIALCIMWVSVLVIAGSLNVAARDAVPKFNVGPSCESTARRMVFVNSSKEACIKQETEAHKVLVRHWSQFAKIDKTNCVDKVSQGGPPSYTELLSCLENMQHARAVRKSL
jgi:hypothetical protein